MIEKTIIEQSIIEQAVIEQAVIEQAVIEQAVIEQPISEQPISEQPMSESVDATATRLKMSAVFISGYILLSSNAIAAPPNSTLSAIQQQWATCQYEVMNEDNKVTCLNAAIDKNQLAVEQSPERSDLKVWLAINKSTLAGVSGSFDALSLVKESKALLEDVLDKDSKVLDGSAFTSLGSLYYKVPGWPISFGSDDKAEKMLKKALAINPDGIDQNYFYGDFLMQDGRKNEAISYLEKAQQAAPRPGRALADQGRQQEIADKLKELL